MIADIASRPSSRGFIAMLEAFVFAWRGESWIPMFQFDGHALGCKHGAAAQDRQREPAHA